MSASLQKMVLDHGDFTEIASVSGVSVSTIQKWYNGKLNIKDATRMKILKGWAKVIAKRKAGMGKSLLKVQELKSRVSEFEEGIIKAISELESVSL